MLSPEPVEGQVSGTPLPSNTQAANNAPVTPAAGQVPAAQTTQLAPMTTIPLPPPASIPASAIIPQTPAAVNHTATPSFQVADDKDVIEPEWVHKAKAIVRTTTDDPYKQSEELTVFKADYMQKRYNKTVKLK